jgi:hypothetical protein
MGRTSRMSPLYLKTAVVWFNLAVGLGIYTGATQDFRLVHVHVHLNLLGWVSLGIIGLTWASFPRLSTRALGRLQFGLHNLGLTIFMGGITFAQLTGNKPIAAIALGSLMVAASVVLFGYQVLRHRFSGQLTTR